MVRRPCNPQVDSLLFKLPLEIRNTIYEFVVSDTEVVAVRDGHVSYAPSLSLACSRLRSEYRPIFAQDAPDFAPRVILHIPNFLHRWIPPFVADLQPLQTGQARGLHLVITLTNTCHLFQKEYEKLKEKIWWHKVRLRTPAGRIRIQRRPEMRADPKSFDFQKFHHTASGYFGREHPWTHQMERLMKERHDFFVSRRKLQRQRRLTEG